MTDEEILTFARTDDAAPYRTIVPVLMGRARAAEVRVREAEARLIEARATIGLLEAQLAAVTR
jgi:hypothetical protein